MSIKGFESITKPLTDEELALTGIILKGFRHHIGKHNAISSAEIVRKMNERGYKITAPRLRKLVNYIRCNAIAPICSNSNGYWWSNIESEIKDEILSLNQRAEGIKAASTGLYKYLQSIKNA